MKLLGSFILCIFKIPDLIDAMIHVAEEERKNLEKVLKDGLKTIVGLFFGLLLLPFRRSYRRSS